MPKDAEATWLTVSRGSAFGCALDSKSGSPTIALATPTHTK